MRQKVEVTCERYPNAVKEAAIRRYLNSDLSFSQVGDELGIKGSTIKTWLYRTRTQGLPMPEQDRKNSTDDRSAADKLRLLLQSQRMSDADLGEFLRREGLKEGDLERWQQEALDGLEAAPSQAADS